jgi:hypothetical protein
MTTITEQFIDCVCAVNYDTLPPAAIDMAPAASPAVPASRMSPFAADAIATPITRLAVETIPSLAPSTAARNQPMRSTRCYRGEQRRFFVLI